MKKFLDLSSWRTALGNLLPSAHGHQGGSRKAVIGFMLIMAFAVVGCDDSSSASAGPNDEPGVESSSSSSGKVTEPAEVTSSSSEKAKQSSSSSSANPISSSSFLGDKNSSSSGEKETSSSSLKSESSSSVGDSQSSNSKAPELAEGFLTDNRDGQTYKTVTIGTQTWMAENLNYETDNSFCFKDSAEYCEKYGRLYTWAAAMDSVGEWSTNGRGCGYGSTCSPTFPVRGICPEGWLLPTKSEFETLFTAVGGQSTAGKVLKSQTGWYGSGNGTNAFGFSALPAGNRFNDGSFYSDGNYAYFWSSTEYNSYFAYYIPLHYSYDNAYLRTNDKYLGFSVRCVKD